MNKEVWVTVFLGHMTPVISFSREQAKQLVHDFMKEQYHYIPREAIEESDNFFGIEESDNFFGSDEVYAVRYVSPLADLMD